jgi:surface antigen
MGDTSGVRHVYSESGEARPCLPARDRPCRIRLAPAVVAGAALFLQGCTVALPSLWERANVAPPGTAQMTQTAADDTVTTGSVRRPAGAPAAPAVTPAGSLPIPQADWDAAKAVLMQALADRADTPSLPWSNAQSGMSGTVTALQRAGGSAGQTCRDFLGSAIKDGKEVWFDGRACRTTGPWAVLELRPWRRS